MRWWPVFALGTAAAFLVSLGGFAVAVSALDQCPPPGDYCDALVGMARWASVISGAALTMALVGGLHAALLAPRNGAESDARPLVSVHARRRP